MQKSRKRKEAAAQPPKEVGFISVSVGKGMTEIFKELGVDYLIEGGQTMNPSTEDMLNAIARVNAKTIYIFPNNKNIILAANQARDLTEDKEDRCCSDEDDPAGNYCNDQLCAGEEQCREYRGDASGNRACKDRTGYLCSA